MQQNISWYHQREAEASAEGTEVKKSQDYDYNQTQHEKKKWWGFDLCWRIHHYDTHREMPFIWIKNRRTLVYSKNLFQNTFNGILLKLWKKLDMWCYIIRYQVTYLHWGILFKITF